MSFSRPPGETFRWDLKVRPPVETSRWVLQVSPSGESCSPVKCYADVVPLSSLWGQTCQLSAAVIPTPGETEASQRAEPPWSCGRRQQSGRGQCQSVTWPWVFKSEFKSCVPDEAFKSSRLRVDAERDSTPFLLLQNELMDDLWTHEGGHSLLKRSKVKQIWVCRLKVPHWVQLCCSLDLMVLKLSD